MNAPDPVIIETHKQPDAAIIWLHGLGADGTDFVPVVKQLQLPDWLDNHHKQIYQMIL